MFWFQLLCEHPTGIKGWHYVQSTNPVSAQESEESRGLVVHRVETYGPNRRWVNLPNFEKAFRL
jgi:hypothetical protein